MIRVGSTYFFNGIEGFKPHDEDWLEFVENPVGFKNKRQKCILGEKCEFYLRKMDKDELIDYNLNNGPGMQIGMFLVKEIFDELKMTIEDLKRLEPLIDKLDNRHKYEKVIYDSYIENREIKLTDEQREKAYAEYKKYR